MSFMSLPEGLASRLCMTAAGRGRPPEAAARRVGLEVVEKLLTSIGVNRLPMRS
jgi:hypothetical protein